METGRCKRLNSDRHHGDLAPKLSLFLKLPTLQIIGHIKTTQKLPIEKFTIRTSITQDSPWSCLKASALNRDMKTEKQAPEILQPALPGTTSSVPTASLLPLSPPSLSGEAAQRGNGPVESKD